jgi:hypothetical protein
MAGFETIVRPAIVPNIRPSAAQKVVAFADPEQGFAVIHGNPAKQLNLTTSISISISRSIGQETQRRGDIVRVYQKQDDGTINKENFVDLYTTNRMRVRDGQGTTRTHYQPAVNILIKLGQTEGQGFDVIEKDKVVNNDKVVF